MERKEYDEHLHRLALQTAIEKTTEAMDKLQEVGEMLDDIAIYAPSHREKLLDANNRLEAIWKDMKEEFRVEALAEVERVIGPKSLDDFLDQMNIAR